METQRASLSLGRWSLWLLLLGLALPSASAQALSYREAVLRAVDQLNERSSEANLYRLLEPSPPSLGHTVEDPGARKPVSFRVKETVCPRPSLQPPEQCDFKENGVLKEYGVTVTVDHWNDVFTSCPVSPLYAPARAFWNRLPNKRLLLNACLRSASGQPVPERDRVFGFIHLWSESIAVVRAPLGGEPIAGAE
nr:PREDICTED: cathelicidin-4-like [Bos indicus]